MVIEKKFGRAKFIIGTQKAIGGAIFFVCASFTDGMVLLIEQLIELLAML